jgi:hypothetical protein
MTESTPFDMTVAVNEHAQARFEKFLNKIMNLGVKLGLPPVHSEYLYDISIIRRKIIDHQVVYIEKVKKVYQVQGQVPVLDGWTLVAKLTYDQRFKDQAMISEVPGQTIPEEFMGTVNPHRCDHCHVQRFRTKAYIVKKDDDIKQIGSTCLGDFIRANTQEMLEYFAKLWTLPEYVQGDEDEHTSHGAWAYGMEYAFAALRHIKQFGFFSSKSDYATAPAVLAILSNKDCPEWITAQPTSEECEIMDNVFASGRSLSANNSFLHNVKLLCGTRCWKFNELNTLVAWIGQCVKPKNVQSTEAKPSVWLGQESDKVQLTFVCETVTGYEGNFGMQWLHIGHDEHDNRVSFYSAKHLFDEGDSKKIKGTIKVLKEFKSVQQTQLFRVKII